MSEPLNLGVIGLGRAFTLMLPTFAADPRIRMVAAHDPRADARQRFAEEFGAKVFEDAEALCADADVKAVYIASPHQFHLAHVKCAAKHGKHVLVEKPMALTVDDCREMIAAANEGGVKLLVGHSHSYDLPYLRARAMIRSGAYGHVRMINALNFTDFLYRPRRPEELDTRQGGGVVFSQAAHQVDIVRLLAGAKAASVHAFTGNWDAARNTEGAYSAQIKFEDGSFASLTYSGYAHFDTDEFMGWWGELGQGRDGDTSYGRARLNLQKATTPADEIAMKNARAYGPAGRDAFHVDRRSRRTIISGWSWQAASAPICARCRTASWSMATRPAISTRSRRRKSRAPKSSMNSTPRRCQTPRRSIPANGAWRRWRFALRSWSRRGRDARWS